jgi:hypothetical protein
MEGEGSRGEAGMKELQHLAPSRWCPRGEAGGRTVLKESPPAAVRPTCEGR